MTPAGDRSRRRLLRNTAGAGVAIALAGVATGCDQDTSGQSDPPADPPQPKPDPDRRIRDRLAADSTALILRYEETVRRHRKLRTELAAYQKRHQRHLDVLLELRRVADLARGGTPTPTPTPTPTKRPRVEVSSRANQALEVLLEAESKVTGDRGDVLAEIADPELARVVASIVACGYVHQSELSELVGRDG